MTEIKIESKGPSVAELQRFIREKCQMEFLLSNNDRLQGILHWFDQDVFSLQGAEGKPFTILRNAVILYRQVD